jgi:hypothetical protein
MSKVIISIIIVFLSGLFIFIIGIKIGSNKQKGQDVIELTIKIDSLETRVATFENLYREHLEECSFISKNKIRVGANGYLQKIN